MPVVSLIVQAMGGRGAAVATCLATLPRVSTHGVKDDQVVAVVEGDDLPAVTATIQEIGRLDGILGVYPVFGAEGG